MGGVFACRRKKSPARSRRRLIGDRLELARIVLGHSVVVELVWDSERVGTAVASSGVMLRVGDDAVSPDDLVAISVSACLMRTFLDLAATAGATVSSYASTATLEPTSAGPPRVIVRAYVISPTLEERAPLEAVFVRAQERSTVSRLLGDHLTATLDVRTLPPDGPAT